jgi:hypothetical protein
LPKRNPDRRRRAASYIKLAPMGFLVRKTPMLLCPCNSQADVLARVCLAAKRSCSKTPWHRRHHRKSTSVDLKFLPHAELFRLRRTTLRARPPLYNPHSRNCAAASRFSPTRFIPPSPLRQPIRGLIASRLWG